MNRDFGELRRRLKELLAVPEAQRTDAQLDEIIELEVQLAPGNRIGSSGPLPTAGQPGQPGQPGQKRPPGGRNFAPGRQGFPPRKKQQKKPV